MEATEPRGAPGRAPDTLAREDVLGRCCVAVLAFADRVAILAGFILVGITALVTASIIARGVFNVPVSGDIEIVELFSAVAIFAMFPYCQKIGGNIQIRLFIERMPAGLRRFFETAADATLCLSLGVIAWRMAIGGIEAHHDHAQTMMLQIPKAWAYGFGTAFLAVATLLAACQLYLRFRSRAR